jgi:hypothetical protein
VVRRDAARDRVAVAAPGPKEFAKEATRQRCGSARFSWPGLLNPRISCRSPPRGWLGGGGRTGLVRRPQLGHAWSSSEEGCCVAPHLPKQNTCVNSQTVSFNT